MDAMAIRILIIDDDPFVRAGVRYMLGGASQLEFIAEGSDGDEAVALVQAHRPDVVLMDIRMERVDGVTATEQVLALPDPPKVVMLTTFDADDMVLRALGIGAHGFLLKDTAPQQMIAAIEQVTAGGKALSPTVVEQVIGAATLGSADPRRDEARAALDLLSKRELDVALAIARGLTNQEIAQEQFLSVATVKATVTHIFDKLDLSNRVQVAIKVHDAELEG